MSPSPPRFALITVPILALFAACSKGPTPPEAPRPVLTTLVRSDASDETFTYAGEVRSRYETPLAFRIPGKITARWVDAGAVVKPGDVLAKLDPADSASSLAAATAQLDLLAADLQRYRSLRERNFVSAAALDAKESSFKAARAQTELARNQAAYTVLRADQAGVVGLITGEVGQVVAAGQTVMRVARADTLEVAIAIPEVRMPNVRVREDAEVTLWADRRASYRGWLRELSPVADPLTRTYAARVAIRDPDARVLLSMTAKVRFLHADVDARRRVPLTAIFQQEGRPAVWIVDAESKITLRAVSVAAYQEDTAVLDGGVNAGERIVVAGVHKLTEGEHITLVDAPPSSESPAVDEERRPPR